MEASRPRVSRSTASMMPEGWAAQAGWLGRIDLDRYAERHAAAFEGRTASAVGEEAAVAGMALTPHVRAAGNYYFYRLRKARSAI